LISWDQNRVEIFIEVKVEAKNQEKATKKLGLIEINISGSENNVEIKTHLNKSGNFNGEFSIDMKIKAPASLNLDLENQFGDVIISEWTGPANIAVEYGTLTASKLSSEAVSIELEFSKGNIGLLNKAEIDLQYAGKFSVNKAIELDLESEFSHIDIEAAERLKINSQYDSYTIGQANRVDFEGEFTGFEIDKLYVAGKIGNEYGNIRINFVSKSFEMLDLSNSFSNIKVYIEKGASFNFELNSEYGDVSLMNDNTHIKIDRKDNSEQYLEGTYGTGDKKGRVIVDVEYGNASLKLVE